jgi:hypothetical protein
MVLGEHLLQAGGDPPLLVSGAHNNGNLRVGSTVHDNILLVPGLRRNLLTTLTPEHLSLVHNERLFFSVMPEVFLSGIQSVAATRKDWIPAQHTAGMTSCKSPC